MGIKFTQWKCRLLMSYEVEISDVVWTMKCRLRTKPPDTSLLLIDLCSRKKLWNRNCFTHMQFCAVKSVSTRCEDILSPWFKLVSCTEDITPSLLNIHRLEYWKKFPLAVAVSQTRSPTPSMQYPLVLKPIRTVFTFWGVYGRETAQILGWIPLEECMYEFIFFSCPVS